MNEKKGIIPNHDGIGDNRVLTPPRSVGHPEVDERIKKVLKMLEARAIYRIQRAREALWRDVWAALNKNLGGGFGVEKEVWVEILAWAAGDDVEDKYWLRILRDRIWSEELGKMLEQCDSGGEK